jgi:hypothetical protein
LSILQIRRESYLFTNINTHSLSLYGYNNKSKVQIEGPVIENLWSFIKSFNNCNIYNCDVIYILLLAQEPVTSQWQTLSHNVVHLPMIKIQTHNISIGSCKSNYHMITATTPPYNFVTNRKSIECKVVI